jgi:serine/threonine protein phosphatase PrpC
MRDACEDALVVEQVDLTLVIIGVADGHGSQEIARWVLNSCVAYLAYHHRRSSEGLTEDLVVEALSEVAEDSLKLGCSHQHGCTLTLSIFEGKGSQGLRIYRANSGDAMRIRVSRGEVITEPRHIPATDKERIVHAGGQLVQDSMNSQRVLGLLTSRAFGDAYGKYAVRNGKIVTPPNIPMSECIIPAFCREDIGTDIFHEGLTLFHSSDGFAEKYEGYTKVAQMLQDFLREPENMPPLTAEWESPKVPRCWRMAKRQCQFLQELTLTATSSDNSAAVMCTVLPLENVTRQCENLYEMRFLAPGCLFTVPDGDDVPLMTSWRQILEAARLHQDEIKTVMPMCPPGTIPPKTVWDLIASNNAGSFQIQNNTIRLKHGEDMNVTPFTQTWENSMRTAWENQKHLRLQDDCDPFNVQQPPHFSPDYLETFEDLTRDSNKNIHIKRSLRRVPLSLDHISLRDNSGGSVPPDHPSRVPTMPTMPTNMANHNVFADESLSNGVAMSELDGLSPAHARAEGDESAYPYPLSNNLRLNTPLKQSFFRKQSPASNHKVLPSGRSDNLPCFNTPEAYPGQYAPNLKAVPQQPLPPLMSATGSPFNQNVYYPNLTPNLYPYTQFYM